MSDPATPNTDNAQITANSLAAIVTAAAPFLGPYGALAALSVNALAKIAPALYADIVALANKGSAVTPEEEAALDAKIEKLKNPDKYFE